MQALGPTKVDKTFTHCNADYDDCCGCCRWRPVSQVRRRLMSVRCLSNDRQMTRTISRGGMTGKTNHTVSFGNGERGGIGKLNNIRFRFVSIILLTWSCSLFFIQSTSDHRSPSPSSNFFREGCAVMTLSCKNSS